jgi:hypothetical protein
MAASKLKFASLSDPSVERFKIEHNYEFQINSRSATPDFSPGLERERERASPNFSPGYRARTHLRTVAPDFSPGLTGENATPHPKTILQSGARAEASHFNPSNPIRVLSQSPIFPFKYILFAQTIYHEN